MSDKFVQQGDVILNKLDKLPEGLKPIKRKWVEEGEATGHYHSFAPVGTGGVTLDTPGKIGDNVDIMVDKDGKMFVEVKDKPADLTHDEHATIAVEPGIYEVRKVREMDHLQGVVREVKD